VALFLFGCGHIGGSHAQSTPTTAKAHVETSQPSAPEAAAEHTRVSEPDALGTSIPERKGEAQITLSLLAVSGFGSAVVAMPKHAGKVPLLVATHGAGGDPHWECERWARVARGRWFVACPRGFSLRRGEEGSYYYPDHPTLEREVTAVVAAARATYGSLVAAKGGVYLGYSQGATMGALMVVEHGAEFPHLVLIEGGSGDWTLKRAERFKSSGGESVFIVCGTPSCAARATASARTLERAGLHAETRYAEGAGHTELGPVGVEAETLLETLAISDS
jgi:predicted esterase